MALSLVGVSWATSDRLATDCGASAEGQAAATGENGSAALGASGSAATETEEITSTQAEAQTTSSASVTTSTVDHGTTSTTSSTTSTTTLTTIPNNQPEADDRDAATFAIGTAGSIGVEVVDGRPRLIDVSAPGFQVKIREQGPPRVEVEFESEALKVRLRAEWRDGDLDLRIR